MANIIRIKRRLSSSGSGAALPTGLRNAELAFNEVNNTLYIGRGGDSTGVNGDATSTPIAGDGAVWTGTATFGTVKTSGDIYANTSTSASGKLVATTEYVDEAVSRTSGAGMSLHSVAADCATTGPLTLNSYYDNLDGLGSVRVAIPQPASAAEGASLYELKGIPNLTYQSPPVQLAANDRVLILGHLDPSMIGIWRIPAGANSTTPWVRDTGYDTAQSFHFGARISVVNGSYAGQTFAVLADAVYPTKDVAGPNFNSLNFAVTSSSVPSGINILFHKVVRAKADTYTIVNGKVVVDGVTLNQNDRFLWTPQGAAGDVTDGGLATGGYTNARAGIWRVNYDKVTGGNAFNVITRAGDLNDTADFTGFNGKKIYVREGATNGNNIFTASSASFSTVAQEITSTSGSVATFGGGIPLTNNGSGGGRTGLPIIDGYQTVTEDLAATPPRLGSVVLVKNETNPVNNGLYYVKVDGAWLRHPSADAAGELFYGSYIRVNNGTVNNNSGFVLTTNQETITPGTDALTFESPTALLDFRAGNGLERVGREFRVKAASARVTVNASGVDVAAGTTSASGVVQLTDSTSSTSTTTAATPNSVKSAYDLASTANTAAGTAQTTANAALPKAGGTMTGAISFAAGQTWPTFNQNTTGTAAGLSSTLAISSGGTGQTTAVAAFDALAPTTTIGDLIYFNGTDNVRLAKPSAAAVLFNDNAGTPSWNATTGTTNVVRSTTPTFETSVVNAAASTTFTVFNEAVTTLNAFNGATNLVLGGGSSVTGTSTLNLGNTVPTNGATRTVNFATSGASGSITNITIGTPPANGTTTTTLQGAVVVAGNLTVNGATTILNTNTLSVDDKNIELGAVVAATPSCTVSAGSNVVTNLSSVANIVVGSTFTASSGFTSVTVPAGTTVASIDSPTQITLSANLTGSGSNVPNAVASIGGATEVTAAGGGITLKGGSDKTIIWNNATSGWEFNQNVTTSGTTVNVNGNSPSIATSGTGTGAVFNAGVTTGNLFGACTAVNVGASNGTCTINNATVTLANATVLNLNGASPQISTSSTGIVNVFNASALTGNLFGACTSITIGANSGTCTINNSTVTLANAATLNVNGTNPTIATSNTGTASVFNTNAATVNVGGGAGTVALGGASTTLLTLGTATAASTTNIATGINPTGVVKAVNVGTAGASGSTTNVNIGSGTAGATTSVSVGGNHTAGGVTINPTTTSTTTATGALIVAGGVGIAENLNVGGFTTRSASGSVVAQGADQAGATALTHDINLVSTAASANLGVRLPTLTAGRVVAVVNRGANAIKIYPATGGNIDQLGANVSRTLAPNSQIVFRATASVWWSEITDVTNSATGTLPVGNGGTGQTTASAAFNALSPVTTLGDLIYGNGTNTNTRLAGNTTTTRQVLTQLGTGSASAAPAWVNQCDIVADCTLDGGTF